MIELTAQPEGLSNLLAAAEAVKSGEQAGTITVDELPAEGATIATEPTLTTAEGLKAIEDLMKNKKVTGATTPAPEKDKPEAIEAQKTSAKPTDSKPALDNSRASARTWYGPVSVGAAGAARALRP